MSKSKKKEQNPLVSVYLVNHNYARYIKQAIESVLTQTYGNLELIIIDDGSTDHSREIIEGYRGKDGIKIIFQENQGLNTTNNIAIRTSKGKYIVRLDADDYLVETAIEKMTTKLESGDFGLCFPDYYLVDELGVLMGQVKRHNFDTDVSVYDQPAHGACTMIRRDALIAVKGYDQEFQCQDGFELWLKIIKNFEVTNINEPLFYYRQHAKSLTKNNERILETRHRIIRKASSLYEIHKKKHLCVVPIRGMETDKPLALFELGGKTLIDITLASIKKSENITTTIVTTPDERIVSHLQALNSEQIIVDHRPLELAGYNTPIEETMTHLFKLYGEKMGPVDTISVQTVEYPFRKSRYLDQLIHTLYLFEVDTVIGTVLENSNFYKHDGSGLYPINDNAHSLALERDFIYREIPGFLTIKSENLLVNEKMLGNRISHVIIDDESALSVTTEYSWKTAQCLQKQNQKNWKENNSCVE